MKKVRNAKGKFVASIDEATRAVEIIQRGHITRIRFNPDGTIEIKNTKVETTLTS